jgi:hypothetical protein
MKKQATNIIVEIEMSLPGSLQAGLRVFIDLSVFRIDASLMPTLSNLQIAFRTR